MPATLNMLSKAVITALINPVSAANTAAATSAAVDLSGYIGDLLIVQHTGAITGTLDGAVQGSPDNVAAYAALVNSTGLVGPQVTAANKVQVLVLNVNNVITAAGQCRFIKYVGTVGTGPVLLGVTLHGFKQVN